MVLLRAAMTPITGLTRGRAVMAGFLCFQNDTRSRPCGVESTATTTTATKLNGQTADDREFGRSPGERRSGPGIKVTTPKGVAPRPVWNHHERFYYAEDRPGRLVRDEAPAANRLTTAPTPSSCRRLRRHRSRRRGPPPTLLRSWRRTPLQILRSLHPSRRRR